MDRYYKVLRTSATGEKLTDIRIGRDAFDAKLKELRAKYGFDDISFWDIYLCGFTAAKFPNQPDMKTWKYSKNRYGYYELRARPADKEVEKDFDALEKLSIRRNDINKCVGIDDGFHYIGYDWTLPDIYLIVTDSKHAKDLTPDCIEISNIEYANLTKDNE